MKRIASSARHTLWLATPRASRLRLSVRAEQRPASILTTTTCKPVQPPPPLLHLFTRTTRTMTSSSMSKVSQTSGDSTAEASAAEAIVQYVVLRRDLIDTWPMGSVVTQGCHASVAAIWENKDDIHTLAYCSPSNLDSMHKVSLEVKGETQLVKLSEKLKEGGVIHKVWVEQPENYPTCLATKPHPKSLLSPFFKKLKLCK